MMTPEKVTADDESLIEVPDTYIPTMNINMITMEVVDLEGGANETIDEEDEEPTSFMVDEPIDDDAGEDSSLASANINQSINASVSSENCKIINESDQMHSPSPDPEGVTTNIAAINAANLTPVKLDQGLKEGDTFTSSPTNSRGELLSEEEEHCRPISRREQRLRIVKCYAMVAIIVLICAIGIPLSAVMIFKNQNNETSFSSSTLENHSPSTTTTTEKPYDMMQPIHEEEEKTLEDTYVPEEVTEDIYAPEAPTTDSPVVVDDDDDADGTTDPPIFDDTDVPTAADPVETDAPVVMSAPITNDLNTTDLDEETVQEKNVTAEEIPVEVDDLSSPTASPVGTPTAAPSVAQTMPQTPPTTPGPDRSGIYFDLINVTSPAVLQDTSSPQALSYLWMVDTDQVLPVPSGRYLLQRYILVVMDHVLHDPYRPTMSQPTLDHCLWEGVVCDIETGDVKEINWRLQGFNGKLVEEMQHLDSLERLDLSENELVGTLDNLYPAVSLKHVYLHNNKFSGPLSEQVGQLDLLESLVLSHNELTGYLPLSLRSSVGRSKPLRWLVLSYNQFSGLIPPDWRMRNLFYLDLGHNLLEGPLPSDWDVNMVRLRHLYLDHNNLSGLLPAYFGQVGKGRLKQLHLNDNQLEGKVPEIWDHKDQLTNMAVHNNNLTVPVQPSTCELSVFELGNMVEFRTDCDICTCDFLCEMCNEK